MKCYLVLFYFFPFAKQRAIGSMLSTCNFFVSRFTQLEGKCKESKELKFNVDAEVQEKWEKKEKKKNICKKMKSCI